MTVSSDSRNSLPKVRRKTRRAVRNAVLQHVRRFTIFTVFAALVAAQVGCGDDGDEAATAGATVGEAHETPQAAFDAFRSATRENDWETAARVLVPESQAMVAVPMIMQASFTTGGEPGKEQSLDALLKKHGIDVDAEEPPAAAGAGSPEEMMQAMVAPVSDVPAFLGELSAWIDKNGDSAGPEGGFVDLGELGEVNVDGDQATATVSTEMGEMPLTFRRVDGTWLIQLPTEGPRGTARNQTAPEVADPNTPVIGTLWIDDKEYPLRHAIAYATKFFDEPCTAVLLTAGPIPDRDLNELKQMLAEDGNDDAFHVWDSQVKLTFDESGELMFVNTWADNASFSSSGGAIDAEMQQQDGRVAGRAALTESGDAEGNSTHHFDVTFDTELIRTDGT